MNILENINNTVVPQMNWDTQTNISYTQLSAWAECPHRWKTMYIDKIKSPPSIHFSFGTAMHETLQEYLNLMYNKSQMKADKFDMHKHFQEGFLKLYKEDIEKAKTNLVTKEEFIEFVNDGLEIIDFFARYRQEHFQKHGWELVGIEMPILVEPNNDYPGVMLMGKLDLVMFDKTTHRIVIWDIKTSTRGWTDYEKKDPLKTSQLVLYKKYYSEQYNVPQENIDVRYFILKRKIPDNPKYPIMKSRIQKFEPSSGKTTVNKMVANINNFIEDCFIKGSHKYNKDKEYTKSSDKKSCKWCPFLNTEHCDAGVEK